MSTYGLIGYGNLGMRHLQSIERFVPSSQIFVHDPFKDEIPYSALVPNQTIDYLIDSSTVLGRINAIENYAAHVQNTVLLEKPLVNSHQMLDDLFVKVDCIGSGGPRIIANCARRSWPIYQLLFKDSLYDVRSIEVQGRNIDLASNFLHFADLAMWCEFGQPIGFTVNSCGIWENTRRSGFYGMDMDLIIRYENGRTMTFRDGTEQMVIFTLESGHTVHVYEEGLRCMVDGQEIAFAPAYQSRLTYWTLTKGSLNFPMIQDYQEACKLQLDIMEHVQFPKNDKLEFMFT